MNLETLNSNNRAAPLAPDQAQVVSAVLKYPPGAGTHVVQVVIHLDSPLDPLRFKSAWHAVIQQHTGLQDGIYKTCRGSLVQYHPDGEVAEGKGIEFKDWHSRSAQETTDYLDALLKAYQRKEFPLSAPPLFRIALIRTGPASSCLVWTFHRVIAGRQTMGTVLNDVFRAYDGQDLTEEPAAPLLGDPAACAHDSCPQQDMVQGCQSMSCFPQKAQALKMTEGEKRQNASLPLTTAAEAAYLAPPDTYRLALFCSRHQIETQTLLTGVWAMILAQYSGKTDVHFRLQTPWAHSAGESGPVCGSDRHLPLRTILCPGQTFTDYLRELEALQHSLSKNSHVGHAAQKLAPVDRNTGFSDTFFSYSPLTLEDLVRPIDLNPGNISLTERLPFPMAVAVEGETGLDISIKYDRRQFNADFIRTILEQFSGLLKKADTLADQPLTNIHLLSPEQRSDLFQVQNPSFEAAPQTAFVHHLFDIQAMTIPHNVAVSTGQNGIRFGELMVLTNQIAHYLIQEGLGPEKHAVLVMLPGIPLAAFALGALKTGGGYLHVDPGLPADEIRFLAADKNAAIILGQTDLPALAETGKKTVLAGNQTLTRIRTMDKQIPDPVRTSPDTVAVVQYRPGSGQKQALAGVTHQGLAAYARDANSLYDFQQGEIFSLYPDSVAGNPLEAVYPALIAGASVLFPPAGFPGKALFDFYRQTPPAAIRLAPAVWKKTETAKIPALPETLRLAVLAGEQATADQKKKWQRQLPRHTRLVNTFGPGQENLETLYTETAADGASVSAQQDKILPFPGVSMTIVNQLHQPALSQVPGMLYLTSRCRLEKGHEDAQGRKTGQAQIRIDRQDTGILLHSTGWQARIRKDTGLDLIREESTGACLPARDPAPIVLVGNSTATARSYKTADRKGRPFFHAPIFIHLYGRDRAEALSLGIPQIAEACVREILGTHPKGPFILIGSCQNAVVAHEAACQLTRMGHQIKKLIIIDENWNARATAPEPAAQRGRIERITRQFRKAGLSGVGKKLFQKIEKRFRSWVITLDERRETLYTLMGKVPPADVRFRLMETLFYRVCEANPHTPSIFDGDVALLYSKGWIADYAPQLNTFYTGQMETMTLDISHSDWFEPEQIRTILDLLDGSGAMRGK